MSNVGRRSRAGASALAGLALTGAASCALAEMPQSGFWYSGSEPGTAFHLQVESEHVFVTWITYDDAGAAQWYVGGGILTAREDGSHRLEVELQSYRGGQCAGCEWGAPQQLSSPGTLELTFAGHARAEASFGGRTNVLEPFVAVRPLYYADSFFRGTWVFRFGTNKAAETIEFGDIDSFVLEIECSPPCLAEHFIIESTIPEAHFSCGPTHNGSNADGCYLRVPPNTILARFLPDDIGRDSMIGQTPDGERVIAVRFPSGDLQ